MEIFRHSADHWHPFNSDIPAITAINQYLFPSHLHIFAHNIILHLALCRPATHGQGARVVWAAACGGHHGRECHDVSYNGGQSIQSVASSSRSGAMRHSLSSAASGGRGNRQSGQHPNSSQKNKNSSLQEADNVDMPHLGGILRASGGSNSSADAYSSRII